MKKPFDREKILQSILDTIQASERARWKHVQRFELKGSDGKWYSCGFPLGVSFTGEKRPYWVMLLISEGTTHGKRCETEAEIIEQQKTAEAGRREYCKRQFEPMSDEQLQAQADYWLK